MLGSYLKKQLPRLLDRTGTETAAYREVGEKILNTLIKEFQCYYLGSGFPEFNNAYRETSSSSGASAGSRTTSTATTTSLSALRMWRPWSTSAPTT